MAHKRRRSSTLLQASGRVDWGARRPVSNRWEPEVQAEMVPIERYPSVKEENRFDRDIKHTARYTRTASVRFENVWD